MRSGLRDDEGSTADDASKKEAQVEKSPKGRYIRFDTRLGRGAYKTVWKGYDTETGIEVAWNALSIRKLPPQERKRVINEVRLLETLDNKYIIKFYGSWFNKEKEQVILITEYLTNKQLWALLKPDGDTLPYVYDQLHHWGECDFDPLQPLA